MRVTKRKRVGLRGMQIGVFLACVLGVVGLGWCQNLGGGYGGTGYLIKNASTVLTMDPSRGDRSLLGLLENADVLIVGDRIAAVGNLKLPPNLVRVIDGRGMVVMPGFVDTHDHLWQSVIRGCGTDKDWFARCVSPLFSKTFHFSEADAYALVRLSTTDLIETGVTTVTDWSHSFNDDFVRGNLEALNDSGLRYAFGMGFHPSDYPTELDIKNAKHQFIDPNPLGSLQIAGLVSAKDGLMTGEVNVAKDLGVKLHVHLLENPDPCLLPTPACRTSFKILNDAHALELGPDFIAAHVLHLIPDEITQLKNNHNSVSHQPLSNMRLGTGIMPYNDFETAGIPIGLGLDGGTNDTADFFNNMRAATGLQRALTTNPSASPTVAEILRVATLGGAEVLGMDKKIGSLIPGKQADVIVIDMNMVNFAPVLKPAAQLVFNGQPQNVKWVFVAGRALKANGNVTGVNERQVVYAAQKAAGDVTPLLNP